MRDVSCTRNALWLYDRQPAKQPVDVVQILRITINFWMYAYEPPQLDQRMQINLPSDGGMLLCNTIQACLKPGH